MVIDSATAGAASILFLVTTCVIYGILYAIKPKTLVNSVTNKLKVGKTLLYSMTVSAGFSFIIARISVQVDKQFLRKQSAMIAATAAAAVTARTKK